MASNNWDAAQYLKFEEERTLPARDLLSRVEGAPKTAADIGCGPGNSTALLARRFREAEITGMDYAEDMLEKARRQYPGLHFIRCDAEKDLGRFRERFGLVFSNACIQWIPNHKKLIPQMFAMLKSGGTLAVQLPMNYSEPIQVIIRDTAQKFGLPLRKLDVLAPEEYHDVLAALTSRFSLWQTTYMHRLRGCEDIIQWYRGTGMRPYLSLLDEPGKAEFEAAVLDEAQKCYRARGDGSVMFPFPRFFFTAEKE